jgi:ornithine carbamoyltransferase
MTVPKTAPTSDPTAEPTAGAAPPAGLLRISDLDATSLVGLLDLAARMKQQPLGWLRSLRGAALGCLFEKPSTRTRVSLAVAAHRLGMTTLVLNRDELQIGHGESWADTGRVLSGYLDALALRTFEHRTVERLAAAASVPVINALSNTHHPCQTLADLLTLRERFGGLAGLTVAFIGDGGSNICVSLLEAAALLGLRLIVASPPGFEVDPDLRTATRAGLARSGGSLRLTAEPAEAVRTAQAIYAEVWTPMDRASERAERARRLAAYRVDRALLAAAGEEAAVLHCLPARRGEEISSEVLDGPRSLAWRQAANRLPTTQALLHTLLTGDGR